jgi:Flp pilus assembly protein TadD
MDPDYADAYSGRGAAYTHKGDADRADRDFDKADELKAKAASGR